MKQYVVGMRTVGKYGKITDGIYCIGDIYDFIWDKNENITRTARTLVFSDIADAEKYMKTLNKINNKMFDKASKTENVNRNEYRTYIKKVNSPDIHFKLLRDVTAPFFNSIKEKYPSARIYSIAKK